MGMFEYASLSIGAAAGVVATVRLVKSPPLKVVVVGYLAALLFLGFGQYGIPFLRHFTEFVDGIAKIVEEPSAASYAAFLDTAAKGDLSPAVRRAGMALMLENPVPGMPKILADAEGKASGQIREEIQDTRERYEAVLLLNRELSKNQGNVSDAARAAAAAPLRSLPEKELKQLEIDLKRFEATEKPVKWFLRQPLDRRR